MMDANATDNLKEHIVENEPRDNDNNVALGTTISVIFDRDVKAVNIDKLFEVSMSFFTFPYPSQYLWSHNDTMGYQPILLTQHFVGLFTPSSWHVVCLFVYNIHFVIFF